MGNCLKRFLPALLCLWRPLHAAESEFGQRLKAAAELEKRANFAGAERVLLALLRDGSGLEPDDARRGVVLHRLGSVYQWEGKYLDSEASYREAIQIWKSRGSEEIGLVGLVQSSRGLAAQYIEAGQYAKAGRLGLDALAARWKAKPESVELAGIIGTMGSLAFVQGRYGEAETYFRRALALWAKLAPKDLETAQILTDLGLLDYRAGRYADARRNYEEAVALEEALLGPNHPEELRLLMNLGAVAFKTEGPAEAIPFYQRAVAMGESTLGAYHPVLGTVLVSYAYVLRWAKRKAEAKVCRRRGEAILKAAAVREGMNYTIDAEDLRRQ
jgi:tetratricopeptide (TPR) repeat protein